MNRDGEPSTSRVTPKKVALGMQCTTGDLLKIIVESRRCGKLRKMKPVYE